MPRGGARPGAGRPRKNPLPENVIPFAPGPRLTFGQALESLRPPAPSNDGSLPEAPSTGAVPAAAISPVVGERPANRSFAKMASQVAAHVAVLAISDSIRKKGLEPNPPDDEDLEACAEQTETAFVRALGDAEVPWWAGMALAYGNLYVGMRVGARKSEDDDGRETAPAADPPPPPPPPIVLGRGPGALGEPPKASSGASKLPRIVPTPV